MSERETDRQTDRMRKNEELTAADWKRAAIIERENPKNDEVKTQIETCKGVSKALNEQKLFGTLSNSNSLVKKNRSKYFFVFFLSFFYF